MELQEFPKGSKYKEQTDIVKTRKQKYFIVLNAKGIFCCQMQANCIAFTYRDC